MKKLTKEKLLNSTLNELGYSLEYIGDRPFLKYEKDNVPTISVYGIGIELIPEPPEVNIKNLGRFMAKYGRYPEAEGRTESKHIEGFVTFVDEEDGVVFIVDDQFNDSDVIITDPRWSDMGVE